MDVHHYTDLHNYRGKVCRTLDSEIAQLDDALHALKHGSPAVTEEYIERVTRHLSALSKEGKRLY